MPDLPLFGVRNTVLATFLANRDVPDFSPFVHEVCSMPVGNSVCVLPILFVLLLLQYGLVRVHVPVHQRSQVSPVAWPILQGPETK